ncbi:polysaccharide biosynthesis protein [Arthrobacter sp. Hiyo6]|nr:polysaccharide biosynthesis protein [Arthrobacter sp. Hiyo6]
MTRLAVDVRRSIGFQAIALAGTTGAAQVIMAVLYILAARSSAPSEFGLVVAAIALATTAVGILDFGTNSYWTKELAGRRLSTALLGKRLASKMLYSALVLGGGSISAILWAPSSSLWMVGPVAMALLINQSFQVPLRGLGSGDLVAISILFKKTIAAIVSVVLLTLKTPPISALWLSITCGGLLSALLSWRLTPKASRPALALRRATNPWSCSGHYGIATVALTARSLAIPILSMFGGASAAGVYAAVSRWTQPMSLLARFYSRRYFFSYPWDFFSLQNGNNYVVRS